MTNESIATILQALEVELHRCWRNSDQTRVAELIHADFFEFGRSGRSYDYAEALRRLANRDEIIPNISDNFKLLALAENLYLLTYRACQQMQPEAGRCFSNRASIWKFEDGRWQMIFHQGTPTDEPK